MSKPIFSVIIPIYNKEPHIKRCLDSVLNQSFKDFEILIIDDNSTDSSMTEVGKYNDKRIRVFHRNEPGPGGYAARNLGISEAFGDWAAFLDADDEWRCNHLEKMYELSLSFPNVSVLSCGWLDYYRDSLINEDPYYKEMKSFPSHIVTLSEYLKLSLKDKRPVYTSVLCVKRTEPVVNGLFPQGRTQKGGDLYAFMKLMIYFKQMAWSNHIGATYFKDAVNMVTKKAKTSSDIVLALADDFGHLLDRNDTVLLRKYINWKIFKSWKISRFRDDEVYNLNDVLIRKGQAVNWFKYILKMYYIEIFCFLRKIKRLLRKNKV